MALFQSSVLKKYLKQQDKVVVDKAYKKYVKYFLNQTIQENIRNSKEEQFQAIFLNELFVKVLGYTLSPNPSFNLTTEYKNQKNARKADGAILNNAIAVGVIELKGTKTKDLESIRKQAFDYKANHKGCKYVITSNFEKLRFYINDSEDFEEFNLFLLTEEQFQLLYLCLSKESIFIDVPLVIKEASIVEEEKITKEFYKDYSIFKRELYRDLVKQNGTRLKIEARESLKGIEADETLKKELERIDKNVKLSLFKKSQKLIDRFLFIFFAEDRGLLHPNSTVLILNKWKDDNDFGDERPLYNLFRQYFNFLDKGRQGTKGRPEIYAYNGGLFKSDPILDGLVIDNDLLSKHALKLANYDFESQVDVNILGHIFENSLNEIESVNAEIEGGGFDKQKSKRKKDGVFYTPKYITKYIVENTIGKLCDKKKKELGFKEEEYFKGRKNRNKKTIEKLVSVLDKYRDWLLQLTICDPACGSGAFLNQALDFLIREHHYIDELNNKVLGGSIQFPDIENTVLENNIFGVDINDESVEIAKLSLWLRTAQPRRKLNDLSSNIKCGNSLVSNKTISGEKAFKWETEFEKVFKEGGFDIVIGNPPYVNANELKKSLSIEEYKYLKSSYITAKGTVDLYIYFFEKGLSITKKEGILSFITPNRFLSASYGKALREFIIDKCEIISLIDYSDKNVFPDASTYPVISFLKHKERENYEILTGKFDSISKQLIDRVFNSSKLEILDDSILGFLLNDKLDITEKVINQAESLKNVGRINATSTAKEADDYTDLITDNSPGYKLINTGTIDPYCNVWGKDKITNGGRKLLNPFLPKDSLVISENRHSLYSSPKIIISKIGLSCEAFYDSVGDYASINTNCIHSFNEVYYPEYVLCWLNSKLFNYTFECFFDGLRMSGGYLLYSAPNLKNTYIKNIDVIHQESFIELSGQVSLLIDNYNLLKNSFLDYIKLTFQVENVTKKLINWSDYGFSDFINEINKLIKNNGEEKLSKTEEIEWLEVFNVKSFEALNLKTEIEKILNQIDHMFYKMYNLTQQEIEIVESS